MIQSVVIGYVEAPFYNAYLRITLNSPVSKVYVKTDIDDNLFASANSDLTIWTIRNQSIDIKSNLYFIYVNNNLELTTPIKYAHKLEISTNFYKFAFKVGQRANKPIFFRSLFVFNNISDESLLNLKNLVESDYSKKSELQKPYIYSNKSAIYTSYTNSNFRMRNINNFLFSNLRSSEVIVTPKSEIRIQSSRSNFDEIILYLSNVVIFYYNSENLILYTQYNQTLIYYLEDYHPVNLSRVALDPTPNQRAVLRSNPLLFPNGF